MKEILEQMRVHYRVMAGCEPINDAAVVHWFREDNLDSWATCTIVIRSGTRFSYVEGVIRVARQLREQYQRQLLDEPVHHHVMVEKDPFSEPMPIAKPVGGQP
jgi:hypothetical protein